MFDPCHIGNVPFESIKYWEIVSSVGNGYQVNNNSQPFFAVINLQGRNHAVILKENRSEKADQVVIKYRIISSASLLLTGYAKHRIKHIFSTSIKFRVHSNIKYWL